MQREREVKVEVGIDFHMPPLDSVAPGLTAVQRPARVLDATYWDTPELELLRAGVGLRFRTTDGGSGTWTLKGGTVREGSALVRDETDVALESERPPDQLAHLVPRAIDWSRLAPIAYLRTTRRPIDLLDAGGTRWAEVADDTVSVFDGNRLVTTFREVEVELTGEADDVPLDAVVQRLRDAGSSPPVATAKYVKALAALGHDVPLSG